MATRTYSKTGTKATTAAKLDKKVFGIEVTNHELLKQAYVAYLANGRVNLAVTKTRGKVRGGGAKPWRQKGTGRARFGSSRVPIWRGGGITFGPTGQENYTKKLSLQAKRQAIRQALSLAATDNKLVVIEDITTKGKTSDMVQLLTKIGATGRLLLVVADKTPELVRACNNLADVTLVQAHYMNVFDVLNADHIVITLKALDGVSEWLKPTVKSIASGEQA